MTKREIASLFLKLIGVYFLVTSIVWLNFLIPVMNIRLYDLTTLIAPICQIIGMLMYWAVLVFLIVKSDIIASKLIKEDKYFELSLLVNRDEIIIITFCCIGLTLLIKVIPDIISVFINWISYVRTSNMFPNDIRGSYWSGIELSKFIGVLFNSVVGSYLFLYPRRAMNLWKRMRRDGDEDIYQFGEAKSMDDLSLDDIKEHPIWTLVVGKGGKGGTYIKPVINPQNVTSDLAEPIIGFRVEGSGFYGSADYDKKNERLVNLTLWIDGKWVLIQDTSDLIPPLVLVAIPRINGRSNVKFKYESFDHSEAFIDMPDAEN